jgi:hypothetical protein
VLGSVFSARGSVRKGRGLAFMNLTIEIATAIIIQCDPYRTTSLAQA